MIGAFGPVAFVVTDKKIRTFADLTRQTAGRWAKHDVLGGKPLTQRIGQGLDTISFNMRFDSAFGMNPFKETHALRELENSGRAVPLTVGGKVIGTGLWVITSLEEGWVEVDNQGNILVATMKISIEEYVSSVVKR